VLGAPRAYLNCLVSVLICTTFHARGPCAQEPDVYNPSRAPSISEEMEHLGIVDLQRATGKERETSEEQREWELAGQTGRQRLDRERLKFEIWKRDRC